MQCIVGIKFVGFPLSGSVWRAGRGALAILSGRDVYISEGYGNCCEETIDKQIHPLLNISSCPKLCVGTSARNSEHTIDSNTKTDRTLQYNPV